MSISMPRLFFGLLRFALCGEEIPEEQKTGLTPAHISALCAVARHHDLAHLMYDALRGNGLLPTDEALLSELERQKMMAISRYEQSEYELNAIGEVLERGKIPFIPLKGAVLRQYYPEPWMRTSCDLDILVHKEDLAEATSLLVSELGYTRGERGPHDVSLFSAGGVHLELHYGTVEEGRAKVSNAVLENMWQSARAEEGTLRYHLDDAMFYFYHIAHMAKHFEEGGCGIRPFMDLWLLEHAVTHDDSARETLLHEGGLTNFAASVRKLCEVWFSERPHDELTREMQNFLLRGGVFGSTQTAVAAKQKKAGGKTRYLIYRLFLPYAAMKRYFPILEKHKLLLPFCWIARWFRMIFRGDLRRSWHELNVNAEMPEGTAERTASMMEKIGLL